MLKRFSMSSTCSPSAASCDGPVPLPYFYPIGYLGYFLLLCASMHAYSIWVHRHVGEVGCEGGGGGQLKFKHSFRRLFVGSNNTVPLP